MMQQNGRCECRGGGGVSTFTPAKKGCRKSFSYTEGVRGWNKKLYAYGSLNARHLTF